ncbi:MAG TPA: hypothetical protein VF336_02035 [Syntrophales bacterium]
MRRISVTVLVVLAVFTIFFSVTGCEGLRFVQTSDEAKSFHPKNIGVLPAEVGVYKDAEGKIDAIITDVLVRTKWFNTVIGGDEIRKRIQANEELKKSVDVYLAKLRELNYSDPELCKVISELCGIEAILIPTVDTWEYTMLSGDKIARVGISMNLVDTKTGKTVWKAGHPVSEEYRFLKPDLSSMARSLVRKMIDQMPH